MTSTIATPSGDRPRRPRRPGPRCASWRAPRPVPRRRRDPGQPDRHRPDDRRPAGPAHLRARPAALRRRGYLVRGTWAVGAPPPARSRPGCPFRTIFDLLWHGRRHVMMGPSQIDRYGNTNISAIGDYQRPEGGAARRARRAGQHASPPDQLLGAAAHPAGRSSPQVDMVCGVGYDRAAAGRPGRRPLPRPAPGRHQPRPSSTSPPRARHAAAGLGASRASAVDGGAGGDRLPAAASSTRCPRPGCPPPRSCG